MSWRRVVRALCLAVRSCCQQHLRHFGWGERFGPRLQRTVERFPASLRMKRLRPLWVAQECALSSNLRLVAIGPRSAAQSSTNSKLTQAITARSKKTRVTPVVTGRERSLRHRANSAPSCAWRRSPETPLFCAWLRHEKPASPPFAVVRPGQGRPHCRGWGDCAKPMPLRSR